MARPRPLVELLNLSLLGRLPAVRLAALITRRYPLVTSEALATLIGNEKQKRRDEIAVLEELEVLRQAQGPSKAQMKRSRKR